MVPHVRIRQLRAERVAELLRNPASSMNRSEGADTCTSVGGSRVTAMRCWSEAELAMRDRYRRIFTRSER